METSCNQKNKRKRKKQSIDVPAINVPSPKRRYADLPVDEARRSEFVAAMRGTGCTCDPVCVLRKSVTHSDTLGHHRRFLLSRDALTGAKELEGKHLYRMMSESDRKSAHEDEGGLSVKVLGRSGNVRDMVLRYLSSNKAYRMIKGDIMQFVAENRMCKGQVFELWAYREGEKLKLGVLNYDKPRADPVPPVPVHRRESSVAQQEANVVDVTALIVREPEAARPRAPPSQPRFVPFDCSAKLAILLLSVSLNHNSS